MKRAPGGAGLAAEFMFIYVSTTRRRLTPEQLGGGELRINCPECGATDVPADAWFQDDTAYFVYTKTTSWVRCSACGAELYSREPADALLGRTPAQLESVVRRRVSPVRKLFVILAWLLFFWPAIGLVMGVAAWVATRKVRGGWRTAGRIAFGLSLLVHIGLGLLGVAQLWLDDSQRP